MTVAQNSRIIVARALSATPTVFADISELAKIGLPGMFRNEFDASTQNVNIDRYNFGFLRRKPVELSLNYLPGDASHDHLTGLYKALIDNSVDGYKFTQNPGTLVWVASGQVQAIDPDTPTDGVLMAKVTLRFSNVMSIQGVTIGT